MPRQVISVIGALSDDTILIARGPMHPGATVIAEQTTELGGRGANIAIAISRCCRHKPKTEDSLLPEDQGDDDVNDEVPDVRMVGAVVNEERREEFAQWLRQNGVDTTGIEVVKGRQTDQDRLTSIFDAKMGRSQQIGAMGVSQNWTRGQLNTIERLGGGKRPNLIVVTMELHRDIVGHILTVAAEEAIDVVVYASPGAVLLEDHYRKIEHLVGSEGDAAVILGRGHDEIAVDAWPEMCEELYSHKGIKNVVLKTGHFGAFFKNEDEEGFISGYHDKSQVVDSSGSTAAFVGVYAAELAKKKDDWDIKSVAEVANKASAINSATVGYKGALPWANEIANFNTAPLYVTINDLTNRPKGKSLPWRANASASRGF